MKAEITDFLCEIVLFVILISDHQSLFCNYLLENVEKSLYLRGLKSFSKHTFFVT